jgi:hypothetical protein
MITGITHATMKAFSRVLEFAEHDNNTALEIYSAYPQIVSIYRERSRDIEAVKEGLQLLYAYYPSTEYAIGDNSDIAGDCDETGHFSR